MEFKKRLKLDKILGSLNLAEMLDSDDLKALGQICLEEYMKDRDSRSAWEERNAESLKMAMQVMEEKSYPWPNASNVKFPLITIAAQQFHSRAYPATVPSFEVVTCRVIGEDRDGSKAARAKRVAAHLSYQRMELDRQWEESHDRLLLILAIMGCAFKKTYHDPVNETQISELVLPKDLVVDYYTKNLETAQRVTHVIPASRNFCIERFRAGLYLEIDDSIAQVGAEGSLDRITEDHQEPGVGEDTPYTLLEQHRYLDLDGDGYKEPYIVTLRGDTGQVLRVVPRFVAQGIRYNKDRELQSIQPECFFTKYSFVPSPDGGFYDIGFGVLLGALNHSIDTLINQLIDAGTLKNLGGGFLGRGVKLAGGDYSFKPGEWKRTDSTGDDLRKSIMPLPAAEPSNTLLALLNLLIEFGQKIGMATDPMTGDNVGQNTKAETSRNMITQGEKIFTAIYKRIYRSMTDEFRKCFRLNYLNPPESGKFEYFADDGQSGFATVEDYFGSERQILPSADPNLTSDEAKMRRAITVRQMSQQGQGYNKYEVDKRVLKAMNVPDIETIYPNPQGPKAVKPITPPKLQIEQMKAQTKQQELKQKHMAMLLKTQEMERLNSAKIMKLEAEAMKLKAEASTEADKNLLALMDMQIQEAHNQREHFMSMVQMLHEAEQNDKQEGMGSVEAGAGN